MLFFLPSVIFASVLFFQSGCLAKTLQTEVQVTRAPTLSVKDAECLVHPSDNEGCVAVYKRYLDFCGVMPTGPVCSIVRPRLVTLCGHKWARDVCFPTVAHSCRHCMINDNDEACYLFKEVSGESEAGAELCVDAALTICTAEPNLPECAVAVEDVNEFLTYERAGRLSKRISKIQQSPKMFTFVSMSGCYKTPEDPFCVGVIQKISSKCKANETLSGCSNFNNNKHVTICLNSKGEATSSCQRVFHLLRSSVTSSDKAPLGRMYTEFLLNWHQARMMIVDIVNYSPSYESKWLEVFVSSGCESRECFEEELLEKSTDECREFQRNVTALTLDDMLDNAGCYLLVHYSRQHPSHAAHALLHSLVQRQWNGPYSLPKDILKESSIAMILRDVYNRFDNSLTNVVQDLMEFCVNDDQDEIKGVCLEFCEAISVVGEGLVKKSTNLRQISN